MKRAVIFSNGEYNDYDYLKSRIQKDDFVICADGAIVHCLEMGVVPDVWLGDFDSCRFSSVSESHPELSECKIVKLDCRKNETDTHIACKTACEAGCDTVIIFGAFGKRIDHMLANISMLEYLNSQNVSACLEDEKNRISIVSDFIFLKNEKKYLSIIPLDSSVTVRKTEGLEYPLENEKLFRKISRGISNEFSDSSAAIYIDEGKALIVESDD